MISRIVLMKFNDKTDQSAIDTMQCYVARIRTELDEVEAYHLAPNQAANGDGYNWMLQSAFADEAAMNAYRDAPLHGEFMDFCDPYTDDFLVAYCQAPA